MGELPIFGCHIGIDESNEAEFKNHVPDNPLIAKNIMAFANSNGGKLYIGVRNDGTIGGVYPNKKLSLWKDEIRLRVDAAVGMLVPTYRDRVTITFHELLDKKQKHTKFLIIVSVPKSDIIYSFPDGEKYIRREASIAKITDSSLKSNSELVKENETLQMQLQIIENLHTTEKILEKLAKHQSLSLSVFQRVINSFI
jgi:predicted HTH transcriptional regulator